MWRSSDIQALAAVDSVTVNSVPDKNRRDLPRWSERCRCVSFSSYACLCLP
jgi:hypothetical protein